MNKIKHITLLVILLSFIIQINLYPFMYIAPPGSSKVIFSQESKTGNNAIKWDEIKPARLPVDEDIRIKYLQEFSCLPWISMTQGHLSLLKAFVIEAQKSFPQFLSTKTINDALYDTHGAFELVRRSHPYTLAVLKNPDLFTHHFRWHEGMYYRLFALKLLGRKSKGPVVVFNVDPHKDYLGSSEYGDKCIEKDGYDIHVVHGIADSNWSAAIVRDGLADVVIESCPFPRKPFLKWFFTVVYRNKSGEVVSDVPENLIHDEFDSLVAKIKRDYPSSTIHWSIDLDSFDIFLKDDKKTHIFFQPEAIPVQLSYLLSNLEELHPHTVSLTTADSMDYLSLKADQRWISHARFAVKITFERTFGFLNKRKTSWWLLRNIVSLIQRKIKAVRKRASSL